MSKKCADVLVIENEIYIRKGSQEERKVANVKSVQKHPYTIGKQWVIQTPTFFFVGTLKAVTENELVLDNAAWVADTGRYNEFLKTGNAKELEPCNGPAIIGRGAVIAAVPSPLVVIEVK